MNDRDRACIHQRIEEEIITVEQDLAALGELIKPVEPDNAVGRLSRMEAISAKSINEAAHATARSRLNGLRWALSRVNNDDDFGICVDCGEEIPIARIVLLPEAAFCVGCAAAREG